MLCIGGRCRAGAERRLSLGQLVRLTNKRADPVKLLYWESDGYVLFYKRLEIGVFRFPRAEAETQKLSISAADFQMILSGVDLSSVKRLKRYRRSEANEYSKTLAPA